MRSGAVDGFELDYDRVGSGSPVVLLHGWPGDRTDYRHVVPLLDERHDVVVPDLRGFGASDKHNEDPAQYSPAAQARSIVALIRELELDQPVIAAYDIGSTIAQQVAKSAPRLVRALVLAPPLPGIGDRVLEPGPFAEFWYQAFHALPLSSRLLDANPSVLRPYLEHFWSHWSGPSFVVEPHAMNHLVEVYGSPGGFTASIGWYRAGGGAVATAVRETAPHRSDRITAPTTALWSDQDPLFPHAWSDRLDAFFADVTLISIAGAGHFAPLEYPEQFAEAVTAAARG